MSFVPGNISFEKEKKKNSRAELVPVPNCAFRILNPENLKVKRKSSHFSLNKK